MSTEKNLATAFAGESQANRKYLAFANKLKSTVTPRLPAYFAPQLKQKLSMLMPTSKPWVALSPPSTI